jgi:hypothetical protein
MATYRPYPELKPSFAFPAPPPIPTLPHFIVPDPQLTASQCARRNLERDEEFRKKVESYFHHLSQSVQNTHDIISHNIPSIYCQLARLEQQVAQLTTALERGLVQLGRVKPHHQCHNCVQENDSTAPAPPFPPTPPLTTSGSCPATPRQPTDHDTIAQGSSPYVYWQSKSQVAIPFPTHVPLPIRDSYVDGWKPLPRHASEPNVKVKHSPYGSPQEPPLAPAELDKIQSQAAAPRCFEDLMFYTQHDYYEQRVPMGGLHEPIVPGRFADESNPVESWIWRRERWAGAENLRLWRLPSAACLIPPEELLVPQHIKELRQRHWHRMYGVWYQFVQNVSPTRFPGLILEDWNTLLEAPVTDILGVFDFILQRYPGYQSLSDPDDEQRRILIVELEKAVAGPLFHDASPSDLIAELKDFSAIRDLERLDTEFLWRATMLKEFGGLGVKHIRKGAYGGDDPRWSVVHAKFNTFLVIRSRLWANLANHRFFNGSYVPSGRAIHKMCRNAALKLLLDEGLCLRRMLYTHWKDTALPSNMLFNFEKWEASLGPQSVVNDQALAELKEWAVAFQAKVDAIKARVIIEEDSCTLPYVYSRSLADICAGRYQIPETKQTSDYLTLCL